ncbi:elongator complex protein 5 [Boleophthalmus pectinirostris]|uniref:elongator complex protein 5 n=1 Tax=Boleophthalmus pectinirostris TaxID=150288 RepID=UPI000A1C53E0|nr:elongator complex protein 5 [Boleophthalmus pectinirostris]
MLLELLQGNDSGGFLLIKDTAQYSGRCLLKSFIKAALNRDEDVHIILFEVSEQELKDGLKEIPIQRLHFHNAYEDPLGWTNSTSFTAHHFCLNHLTQILKQTSQPKSTTLVIDSLSWILRHVDTTNICSTLHQLKKGGAVRTIVGLLHADMHQKGTVGSVCHLATSLITVAPGNVGDTCVAKITKRTKSGKVLQEEHSFRINEDLTVTMLNKSPNTETVHEEHQMDPTANLTFNLRLSDKEREAKEKLLLPFMFSKDKKNALLHSGAGSGRILYEPDASDDYDQEDPDDDLDV